MHCITFIASSHAFPGLTAIFCKTSMERPKVPDSSSPRKAPIVETPALHSTAFTPLLYPRRIVAIYGHDDPEVLEIIHVRQSEMNPSLLSPEIMDLLSFRVLMHSFSKHPPHFPAIPPTMDLNEERKVWKPESIE